MKCFLVGMLGGIAGVIVAMFAMAQYTDFTGRSQTSRWLSEVRPVQAAIEAIALERKELTGIRVDHDKARVFSPMNVELFEVDNLGQIFIRGGKDAQLLVLIPSLVEGEVKWRCIGGSAKAVVWPCREKLRVGDNER